MAASSTTLNDSQVRAEGFPTGADVLRGAAHRKEEHRITRPTSHRTAFLGPASLSHNGFIVAFPCTRAAQNLGPASEFTPEIDAFSALLAHHALALVTWKL